MAPRLTDGRRERTSILDALLDMRSETARLLREAAYSAGVKRVAAQWGVGQDAVYKCCNPHEREDDFNEPRANPLERVVLLGEVCVGTEAEDDFKSIVHYLIRRFLSPAEVAEVEDGYTPTKAAAGLIKESGEGAEALLRHALDPTADPEQALQEIEDIRRACDIAEQTIRDESEDPVGKRLVVRRQRLGGAA